MHVQGHFDACRVHSETFDACTFTTLLPGEITPQILFCSHKILPTLEVFLFSAEPETRQCNHVLVRKLTCCTLLSRYPCSYLSAGTRGPRSALFLLIKLILDISTRW